MNGNDQRRSTIGAKCSPSLLKSAAGMRLERSLDRDIGRTKLFEHDCLDTKLSSNWASSLIIVGAGPLGLRVLAGLRRLGIEPLAFADNQMSKWSSSLGGLVVFSPAEAVERFGTSSSFVVSIWRSKPVMDQLAKLGCVSITEFKALFWRFFAEFLPNMRVDRPHLILQEAAAVRDAFCALSDDASRGEFARQIEWLLDYDFAPLPVENQSEQYFEQQLFTLHRGEVFVDCGAFTGDTLQSFLRHCPEASALHAFEPEPINLAGLLAWRDNQSAVIRDRVFVHPFAAADRRQSLRFNTDGVGSSADRHGTIEVEAVALDEALACEAVTFIKMDIEGGESDAIKGAARLIARCRPVLAVCLYHRQEHLFTIPNLLRAICDDYQYFIRRYGDEFGDIVCYAVPAERVHV